MALDCGKVAPTRFTSVKIGDWHLSQCSACKFCSELCLIYAFVGDGAQLTMVHGGLQFEIL